MISRRQPHQQPLPAAVTGRDPALTERRTLLKAIIFGAGSLAVGCGSDKPRGGTAGGFELDRTDDVKSPEQIQAEAIRARDINLRAVRHIVSGLQAKCSTEFRFDPTGNRGIFTDADARSNDNLRGPEQTLDYDHDTRQLTATQVSTIDRKRLSISATLYVNNVNLPVGAPLRHALENPNNMVFGSLEFTNGDVNGDVEAHFKDVNATGNLQVERMTGSSNVSSGDFHSLDDEFNLAEGVLNRMGADH